MTIIDRLRDEARQLQSTAWSRSDGGMDCCLASVLADEAASLIDELCDRAAALLEVHDALGDGQGHCVQQLRKTLAKARSA